jgi:hypothetical protein
MNPTTVLLVLSLLIACGTLLHVAVDRHARATAWRRIAEERRWDADRRR